jgi:CRP-like cAMP-binding protein
MPRAKRADGAGGNRILTGLSAREFQRLEPSLTPVALELKDRLLDRGETIGTVYFPETAVVSFLTRMDDGSMIEIATIGNEGLVGVPVFLGAQSMGARDFYQVQVPGRALAMETKTFVEITGRDPFRGLILRYAQALFSQVTQQVACNGLHSVEERCSRWLLLTHDRVGSDEFLLTQEFLAQMLGVRRASVSVAAGILQKAGFIRYSRGRVTVLDREGLEQSSCECYGIIRAEFDRLLP